MKGIRFISTAAAAAIAMSAMPAAIAADTSAAIENILDFSKLEEQNFTANTVTSEDIYEIHNANGDKLNADGIYFANTSVNSKDVPNISSKRYILVRPEYDIELTASFTGTYVGSGSKSYTARSYIVDVTEEEKAGNAETGMSKSYNKEKGIESTAGNSTLTKSNLTVSYEMKYNMSAGHTYAIYNFAYTEGDVRILVTSLKYTKTYSVMFGENKLSAPEGGYITVPSPEGEQGKTILGWTYGDKYYYPGEQICIDEVNGLNITDVAYNSVTPLDFVYKSEVYNSVILGETTGLTSGTVNNTYTYDKDGLYVSAVTSAGDIITADNGINFITPSFGESGTVETIGKKGRYIVVKPSKDGKFTIKGFFQNTGSNVGRIYYKDMGSEEVNPEDIYALDKYNGGMTSAAEANANGDAKMSLNTKGIEMTAGHSYVFAFYCKDTSKASFFVKSMQYATIDAVETPKPTDYPTPELEYMPDFKYEMVDGSLVEGTGADGSKAAGFLARFKAEHGGTFSKVNLTLNGTDKGTKPLGTELTLQDGSEVVFGVIVDGIGSEESGGVEMAANETSLEGKTVYAFGDSIVYGHNDPDNAFMNIIAENEGMTLKKYAQNGATVCEGPKKSLINQINNASDEEPDYVVFEGYTNDAYPETLQMGEMQGKDAVKFDTSTYCGSFEHAIYTMKQKWPNAKYVFVTIHKSYGRDWNTLYELREKSMEMCNEWGIAVADVFGYTTMDTRETDQQKKYLIGGAGSHPNRAACEKFYVPVITQVMKSL